MRPLAVRALLITAVLIAAPLLASPAFAATSAPDLPRAENDPITWSVKPADDQAGPRASFEYATDPGTQVNDSVLVVNSGAVPADFTVYATDAINDFESGDLSLLAADKKPSDAGSWITLDVAELHLEPGTQATVPFTMLIPSDATPGDHSAGIVASSTTTGENDGQAVIVDQRVGARLNLRVSGAVAVAVESAGLVSGFSPSFNPFAPGAIDIDYSVANKGNIRLDVVQKLDIVGPFGIHLGTVTPDPVENLLPGQAAHTTARVSGVGALLLAWSTVRLEPGPIGSAAAPANDPTAVADPGAPVDETLDPNATVAFAPASATTMTIAVSWTLLVLLALTALGAFLVIRYVRTTRERFYDALDQATETAREQAARDVAGTAAYAESPTR